MRLPAPLPAAALLLAALATLAPWARAERLSSSGGRILRHAERSGGGLSTVGTMVLNSTVGDPGARNYSNATQRLSAGYEPLSWQAGSVVAITTATKSTDTLVLTWRAPGADGFLGSVVNGFYRVDYTSETTHVFSPTTYKLEFSTNVAPNDEQFLTLTGLLPNTTYYARIYLADDRKFFAENSAPAAQSTLAGVPVSPAVSAVTGNSVTISWTLPAGGAEGFSALGSSTNFGALFPGGQVKTSATPSGIAVSLTIDGLLPLTTYYFQVGSLNWQGEGDYVTVVATRTGTGIPPIGNLLTSFSPLTRSVTLTWTTPDFPGRAGVLVLLSTSAAAGQIQNGTAFSAGQVLADSATVKATALAESLTDSGLTLDTTYFYHLFTYDNANNYSVKVTTAAFLDLPPLAAAGLTGEKDATGALFTLRWSAVRSNSDGSAFPAPGAPRDCELTRYEVFRATSIARAGWSKIAVLSTTTLSHTDALPDPSLTYLYKVEAVDSLGTRDSGMAVDSNRNLYAFTADGVTRLMVPPELMGDLLASSNRHASDLLIKGFDEEADASQKVVRAARFDFHKTPDMSPVQPFAFSRDGALVSMLYSGGAESLALSNLPPLDDEQNLGLYWNNGNKYIKLFGNVDTEENLVWAPTGMGGGYQIRPLKRAQDFQFDVSQISNKALTPNGDGLNDAAVFNFENPRDSAFSGKILDQSGAFIADMTPGPVQNSLQWDGKANGRTMPGGVYVYQISAENKKWSGTLLLIR